MQFSKFSFVSICASMTLPVLAQQSMRPNIVILLADDMGHGDLSITGGKTPTPNIDRIIRQGVVFENFMTCPVSSPTRAGLLTAMHPLRTGQGPETDGTLDTNIPNIGSYFQKEGYRTGLFGKWHNGESPNLVPGSNTVNKYGFDRFVGFYAGAVDYFSKASTGWFHDDKLIENELDYSTDLISKYAIEFMDKSKKENRPFMCYVPFNAVHGPHVVKEELLKRVPAEIMNKIKKLKSYEEYRRAVVNMPEWRKYNAEKYHDDSWNNILDKLTPEETAMLYSAVITSLDDNVGKIMNYLQKNKLLDNTIVLFFSDNGGTEYAGNNAPFSGFKHSLLEGGVHAAAAMMIPQKVLAVTSKQITPMCGYLDIFPTLADLTKSKQKLPSNLDGLSLVGQIKGNAPDQTNRYYYWVWRDHDAIRSDKWKLFRYIDKMVLYDMVNDISEKTNVADKNPEVVKQLVTQMNIEARKNGAACSHLPLPITPLHPNPSGNVLAINIESNEALSKQKQTVLDFEFQIMPDSYLEYDMMVDSTANLSNAYFSLSRKEGLTFENNGVNTDGKLLRSSSIQSGIWKRVAVGLCGYAPLRFSKFGIGFKFKSQGKATMYIDNICIKNLRGEVVQAIFNDSINNIKLKKGVIVMTKLPSLKNI